MKGFWPKFLTYRAFSPGRAPVFQYIRRRCPAFQRTRGSFDDNHTLVFLAALESLIWRCSFQIGDCHSTRRVPSPNFEFVLAGALHYRSSRSSVEGTLCETFQSRSKDLARVDRAESGFLPLVIGLWHFH